MSADLFAEFGNPQQQSPQIPAPTQQQQSTSTFSFFDDLSAPQTPQQSQPQTSNQSTNDDDDWGDFTSPPQPAAVTQDLFAFPAQSQPSQEDWQKAPVYKAKKSYDSNVLFDAEEDVDDNDDFGDFEGTPVASNPAPAQRPAPAPASSGALIDLLGDLDISQPQAQATIAGKAESKVPKTAPPPKTKKKVHGFGPLSKAKGVPSTPTPPPQKGDDWETFDDWEASIPAKRHDRGTSIVSAASLTAQPAPSNRHDEVEPGELPPTNVPPPQLLLSLFPPLFAEAQERLFKPMAAQPLPMRNRLLSDPGTTTYLQGYLALASVAARIIAGRKLRWKRDVHLSQGMRIGPASSRATSGMKLTGIDKSENMKEEREVADVVRAWKNQIGRLRHVVAAVNQAKAGSLGSVPDLRETMAVRALKQSEGGIPARTPCMLCGLKREERLAADTAVDDSFGEWWVEQASMHRGCRNFWREHKDRLRQR